MSDPIVWLENKFHTMAKHDSKCPNEQTCVDLALKWGAPLMDATRGVWSESK